MSADEADAAKIKQLGWRQGAFVPRTIIESLQKQRLVPANFNDQLIVISHDCDVTRGDFRSEPNVEFLIVRTVAEADGNFQWCNNPRKLHIKDEKTNLLLSMKYRFMIAW